MKKNFSGKQSKPEIREVTARKLKLEKIKKDIHLNVVSACEETLALVMNKNKITSDDVAPDVWLEIDECYNKLADLFTIIIDDNMD